MNEERNSRPLRLAVIPGSTREGRFADTLLAWLLPLLREDPRFEVDLVDLRHAGLCFGWGHVPAPLPEGTPSFPQRIARADAFLFLVPEYNHSFPSELKAALDSAYGEWKAKPASFISYDGVSGGLRAVEQLRLVLAELHVVGLRDGVSFHHARRQFDAQGRLRDPDGVGKALQTLLQQLTWWATALRTARHETPYGI
jgi:NAD(P)H-dependent FMN reductase